MASDGYCRTTSRALFVKPVVAIHPGVGNITQQWPAEHFAALIDLLIEKNGVNIVLVGGPDEVEIADEVMAQVLHSAMPSLRWPARPRWRQLPRAAAQLRAVYRQ